MTSVSLRGAGDGRWVEVAGRAGLVAKGVIYFVVGALAIQIPLGLGGQAADREGALQAVAREPLGGTMLVALGLGFAGYAVWRLVQAVLDRDREGADAKGVAKRLGHLGKGIIYAGSSLLAFGIVLGARRGGGSSEQQETAQLLGLPLGRWLVAGAGAAFMAAGLFNAFRAVTARFRKHLREHEVGRKARPWVIAVGVAGHAARGVVFTLVGIFLLRAALFYDPQEAIGLDGALLKLAQQPYGGALLGSVAAGLLAYALYCFVQARYRDV